MVIVRKIKTGTFLVSIRAPGGPEMNSTWRKVCIYILDLTASLFSVARRHIAITKDWKHFVKITPATVKRVTFTAVLFVSLNMCLSYPSG